MSPHALCQHSAESLRLCVLHRPVFVPLRMASRKRKASDLDQPARHYCVYLVPPDNSLRRALQDSPLLRQCVSAGSELWGGNSTLSNYHAVPETRTHVLFFAGLHAVFRVDFR